ncbi:unnamed protein product, partial [Lampetra planeri]
MAGERMWRKGFQADRGFNVRGAACHVGLVEVRGCSQSSSITICRPGGTSRLQQCWGCSSKV